MNELSELFAYPLTGLYNECHDVDYDALASAASPTASGKYALRGLNNLWWREALSVETLKQMTAAIERRHKHTKVDSLVYRAILDAPDLFVESVTSAPRQLAMLDGGARKTFAALESLQIFCDVYSDTISAPYRLSLQEGLVLDELSSEVILQTALDERGNPYLDFIRAHYLPVLDAAPVDLLWLVGPIKMSTAAMAMLAKERYPHCHVCVVGHATEYYSLAKISKYLLRNSALFEMVDSIVLDDFETTMPQLYSCLAAGQDLSTVPNLMFRRHDARTVIPILSQDSNGKRISAGEIEQTPYVTAESRTLEFTTHSHGPRLNADPTSPITQRDVADVKLWPNTQCYWNACNFCAINRKYQTLPKNLFNDAEQIAVHFAELESRGVRFVWSTDEAIPPGNLHELAVALSGRHSGMIWETRSKIDANFTDDVCAALGKAGLREIRLGLESASPRVLAAMGKFPKDWSLPLIERIVASFHSAGVSVHFPCIIGFPTETAAERAETYSFLEYIVGKYPSVTFNINVLGLDVASRLFERYDEFGITEIRWPVASKNFLGNLLDWDCQEVPFNYDQLDAERNAAMRELLYPWMPKTARIPVYIFYRLSETSRSTLVWKAKRSLLGQDSAVADPYTLTLVASRALAVGRVLDRGKYDTAPRYRVYDWESHNHFECDEDGLRLIEAFKLPQRVDRVFTAESAADKAGAWSTQIAQLLSLGILREAAEAVAKSREVSANIAEALS